MPDRVTAHLLGDDELDSALRGLVQVSRAGAGLPEEPARRIGAAASNGGGLVHLLDQGGNAGRLAVDALAGTGCRPLVLDVAALATRPRRPPCARWPGRRG